ncbi:MAG TPA: hypothetical protein VID51_10450 [Solirubrobacterales bacterium]
MGDEEPTVLDPGESGGIIEPESLAGGVAVAKNRIWVATNRDVYLLSPKSHSPLSAGAARNVESLVARANKLWILSSRGKISELELFANGFGLTKLASRNEILDITYANGAVWALANPRDVLRLPPQGLPQGVLGQVPRPNLNDLVPPEVGIGERVRVRQRNTAIAFGNDMLWLYEPGGRTIRRLDPHTGRLRPSLHPGIAFDDVAVNADGLWLAQKYVSHTHPASRLTRFDPNTMESQGSIRLPGVIQSMALDRERLWVTLLQGPPSPLEPALLIEVAPE